MTALSRLITSVQNGSARQMQFHSAFWNPDQDMEQAILYRDAWNAYKGSMDAAITFFEGVVPTWDWGKYVSSKEFYATRDGVAIHDVSARDDVPARALLLVGLLALAEERGEVAPEPEIDASDDEIGAVLTAMAGHD